MCTKNGSYCEKEKKSVGGGQGRCEQRSEAFMKIQKKIFLYGGGGGGGSGYSKKIYFFFWGGGGLGGGGWVVGVRVDVN